jgi:hypothetical protein
MKVWLDPRGTLVLPAGLIEPPRFAEAVIVCNPGYSSSFSTLTPAL